MFKLVPICRALPILKILTPSKNNWINFSNKFISIYIKIKMKNISNLFDDEVYCEQQIKSVESKFNAEARGKDFYSRWLKLNPPKVKKTKKIVYHQVGQLQKKIPLKVKVN